MTTVDCDTNTGSGNISELVCSASRFLQTKCLFVTCSHRGLVVQSQFIIFMFSLVQVFLLLVAQSLFCKPDYFTTWIWCFYFVVMAPEQFNKLPVLLIIVDRKFRTWGSPGTASASDGAGGHFRDRWWRGGGRQGTRRSEEERKRTVAKATPRKMLEEHQDHAAAASPSPLNEPC